MALLIGITVMGRKTFDIQECEFVSVSNIDDTIEVWCKSIVKTEDFMKEFWPKAFLFKNSDGQWFCTHCDCVFEDFIEEPSYKFCPQCGRKFIPQFLGKQFIC